MTNPRSEIFCYRTVRLPHPSPPLYLAGRSTRSPQIAEQTSISVALVDDDREIRTLVSDYLQRYGIRCLALASIRELERALTSESIDLLLLDIMLPDGDGLKTCQHIRETSRLPIILLTALAEESDRVLGLEMGADDYLTKPFSARELLARIRAVLRRADDGLWVHRPEQQALSFAGWQMNTSKRTLTSPKKELITLTGGEFDLLFALASHPGKVLNRDQLLELTKGRTAQAYDRAVDVQLSRLRRKLDDESLIKTVRGGGYLFAADVVGGAHGGE